MAIEQNNSQVKKLNIEVNYNKLSDTVYMISYTVESINKFKKKMPTW